LLGNAADDRTVSTCILTHLSRPQSSGENTMLKSVVDALVGPQICLV
jgi:hypothetical protein